ncbi:pyridoxal phosphate-dependent transferase [Nemania sp. FL0031]|nr:pyridoxal phosphate-dependent transferase [Nemania sp. FL0031]
METPTRFDTIGDIIGRYWVLRRGGFNCVYRDEWGSRERSMANPWSPNNPDGVVILRLAENSLMHERIAEFFHKQVQLLPADYLIYSIGLRGSLRLRVTPDDLCITPALQAVWATCNPNDIMKPYYSGFIVHVIHRSGVKLVGVDYEDVPGYSGLDGLFLPGINTKALEAAMVKAKENGALMITHNPLGRCYNAKMPNPTPFTSVLSLDWDGLIDSVMVHVDFVWSLHAIQDAWAAMLEDREWFEGFFTENHKLMARNYVIATSFFRKHQIEYFKSNAGLFIWLDLRRFLLPKSYRDAAEYGELKVTSPKIDTYRAREARLAALFMENKVFVSPGALYAASEYG